MAQPSLRSLIFEASVSSSLPSPPSLFHTISFKALNILSYIYPTHSNYHDSLPVRTLFWILPNLPWIIEQLFAFSLLPFFSPSHSAAPSSQPLPGGLPGPAEPTSDSPISLTPWHVLALCQKDRDSAGSSMSFL